MRLDIRLPIGILFAVIGAALTVFGATSDPSVYVRSLGHNVNIWWGVVLLVFGATFTWFGARSRAEPPASVTGNGQTRPE